MKGKTIFLASSALLLSSTFSTGAFAATPQYNISTFVDMSVNSAFAQKFCPVINGNHTCYIEGSTRDILGNLYVSAIMPKGHIFKVTPNGKTSLYATFDLQNEDPLALDSNYSSYRVTVDLLGNLYVSFRALDSTTNPVSQNPTDMNGIWRVPLGGGHCSLDATNTCEKIWPAIGQKTNPVLRWVDGITLDGKGHMYLADGQMGNIWKINLFTKKGALWAGTDTGQTPNFLQGNPLNIILGSPLAGRGFGVLGLAYDDVKNVVYGATFDTGSVVAIPVKRDGTAGTQSVSLNLSSNDQQLDSIYVAKNLFNPDKRQLLVGVDLQGFIGLSKFVGCAQGIPGFCPAPFVPSVDGHQIWAADLDTDTLNFNLLVDDPQLNIAASVVNGVLNPNTLYIDALGQNQGTGSKVLKLTPVK